MVSTFADPVNLGTYLFAAFMISWYSVKFKGVIGDDFDLNDYIYQCRGDDIWASGNVHVEVIKRLNAVLENRESILNNIASKLEAVKKKSMLQIEELF